MAGVTRRDVFRKSETIKEKLKELDESVEREKGLTLDEKPDTEDPITADVLDQRQKIDVRCKDILVIEKLRWRLTDFIADENNQEHMQKLLQLENLIENLRRRVSKTTLSRRDLGILRDLALKCRPTDSQRLSHVASKNTMWPSINDRSISEVGYNLLEKLCLTDVQLFDWWYGGSAVIDESSVWKDLTTLSEKVVILRTQSEQLDTRKNSDLESFQQLVKDATLATANLVNLLADYPDQERDLSVVFILIVHITFVMSNVVKKDIDVVLEGVNVLKPILANLKDLLSTFGGRLLVQPFIAAANDDVLNSSSIPNPSMLDPSEEDDCSTGKAEILVTTGLIANFGVLRKMFAGFTTLKRDKAISIFRSERETYSGSNYSIQDLVKLGLKNIDIDFSKSIFLGRGSYGEITGHWSADGIRKFAVKKPLNKSSHSSQRTWNRLIREAEIWCRYQHPNICRLQGFCEIPDHPFPGLVMDECIQSIDDYLRTYPTSVTEVDQFMLLKDVASGLSPIHEHGCAHGDLRAANILVRRNPTVTGMTAVLSDFGISDMIVEVGARISSHSTGQKTNEAWLAPEFFKQKKAVISISAPADVYAFGCVFLEVLTQREPFDFPDSNQYASFSIRQLKRKKVLPSEGKPFKRPEYFSFMKKACAFEPHKRPEADVLINEMETFGEQAVISR